MIFEEQRQLLTDIDFLVKNSSELLLENTVKNKIFKDYIINKNLNLIQFKAKKVLQFDKDVELNKITNTSSELTEFYQELKKIKLEFNQEILLPSREERGERDWEFEKNEFEKMFTGEEGLGNYLDLLQFYQVYLQFSNVKRIKYLDYVKIFYDFTKINQNLKDTAEYKKYVKDLGIYMETFIAKTRPLLDLDERKEEILKKFKNTYSKEEISKEFYCKFCQKEFQKETVYASHLKGKKHLKNLKNPDILKEKEDEEREVKMWEFLVQEYTQELHNVIEETVFHVERKQTLTEKEYMDEAMDEPVVLSDVESDDSEALYNPLKLPMGWDGKPIPYWLYKLHGLGVEYKCEICGNFVYMGRKAFEGHFSAFRHIYGLRCLGITNTRHFSEITSIQDALDLWERLQNDERKEEAARDAVEEYEDDYGNVFNKKTYEDLKRQGLL